MQSHMIKCIIQKLESQSSSQKAKWSEATNAFLPIGWVQ